MVWEGLNIDGVDTENVEGINSGFVNDDLLFYGDALGLASANLTETSSSGSGGLLNIQEGEIELSLRTSDNMIECGQDPMFHYIGTTGTNIPIPPGLDLLQQSMFYVSLISRRHFYSPHSRIYNVLCFFSTELSV